MYTITPIIRPEHYVLPVKHPANCRCTQHGSKAAGQVASTSNARERRSTFQSRDLTCLFEATHSNAVDQIEQLEQMGA